MYSFKNYITESFEIHDQIEIIIENKQQIINSEIQTFLLEQKKNKKFKTNLNNKRSELFFKKNSIEKLGSFFLKKGKKKKALTFLNKSIFNFFFELIRKRKKRKFLFQNYNIFLNVVLNDNNVYNVNSMLNWLLSFNKFSFFFKTKKLPIFLKKKLKKKYIVEPLIIKKNFREKYTLKFFFFFCRKNER